MTFAAPEGTTAIDQLVICGAGQCLPGATMHAQVVEVTVDDPIPPSISLGRSAGERAVGERARGGSRTCRCASGQRRRPERHSDGGHRAAIRVLSVRLVAQASRAATDTPIAVPVGDLPEGRTSLIVSATRRGRKRVGRRPGRVHRQHAAGSRRPAGDRRRRMAPHQQFRRRMDQSVDQRRADRSRPLEALHDRWGLPFTRSRDGTESSATLPSLSVPAPANTGCMSGSRTPQVMPERRARRSQRPCASIPSLRS